MQLLSRRSSPKNINKLIFLADSSICDPNKNETLFVRPRRLEALGIACCYTGWLGLYGLPWNLEKKANNTSMSSSLCQFLLQVGCELILRLLICSYHKSELLLTVFVQYTPH